jgi:predicted tellurium resistance membrane protein TerC
MGLDNVLAVAGASHGSFFLVLLGLLISVPIVVWGSTLILKWVERFPVIIYIGSGVLAWTASKMIVDEPFLKGFFDDNPVLKWGLSIVIIAGVVLLGRMKNQNRSR